MNLDNKSVAQMIRSTVRRFHPIALLLVLLPLLTTGAGAQQRGRSGDTPEARTVRYFDSIRTDPLLLAAFMREMPKGGDLHNHLSGAIYAEDMIEWAAESGICIDRTTLTAETCDNAKNAVKATDALNNPEFYRTVVDAWSTRNWQLSGLTGHDQFFDTFGKFSLANSGRYGDMLAEAMKQAARDRISYLELMLTPDGGRVAGLGTRVGWDDDFAAMRENLIAAGLRDSLRATMTTVDEAETREQTLLGCTSGNDGGTEGACGVKVRYLYQVLRGIPKEMVFAQILAGFELAEMDPRFVGFNLVMPEDYPVPLRDFDLQMRIIDFLRPIYKKAHITLHAGELAPGLVSPNELCCHIRESVELGHAERIGHGVDIAYEDDPFDLLHMMADRNVMVEICLTSNDVILGIRGNRHPLHLYKSNGIPMALATDDEGVSRIDLTHEFVKAVLEQGLSYLDLKEMVRTSLEHSFLPGESIWTDLKAHTMRGPCKGARPDGTPNNSCSSWLGRNEKAALQWKLETAFARFEAGF